MDKLNRSKVLSDVQVELARLKGKFTDMTQKYAEVEHLNEKVRGLEGQLSKLEREMDRIREIVY